MEGLQENPRVKEKLHSTNDDEDSDEEDERGLRFCRRGWIFRVC
jgi:hypothetical protein